MRLLHLFLHITSVNLTGFLKSILIGSLFFLPPSSTSTLRFLTSSEESSKGVIKIQGIFSCSLKNNLFAENISHDGLEKCRYMIPSSPCLFKSIWFLRKFSMIFLVLMIPNFEKSLAVLWNLQLWKLLSSHLGNMLT